VKARIGEFIEKVYQRKRIHSALRYLTPAKFEDKWYRTRKTVTSLPKDGQTPSNFWGPLHPDR